MCEAYHDLFKIHLDTIKDDETLKAPVDAVNTCVLCAGQCRSRLTMDVLQRSHPREGGD